MVYGTLSLSGFIIFSVLPDTKYPTITVEMCGGEDHVCGRISLVDLK